MSYSLVGILTEKPSAARNFAKALGGNKGSFNGVEYIIVSARGHLYEFAEVSDMVTSDLREKYKSWNVKNLPWEHRDLNWKRKPKEGVATLLSDIKKTLSACSEIAIATDVDPSGEGDLLAFEILEELKLTSKQITRLSFIDESEKEIQQAFKTRKHIPNISAYSEYKKALYRSKFDFLTMQFTRISLFASDNASVLRQGRLKSAMVAITGDGLKALAEYKKIPFYQNKFRDENDNIYTNQNEPQFAESSDVPNNYKPSAVIKESVERKSMPPKKLIDLATLAAILAPKGYKSNEVLETYQKMYEAQIVSYPRTEDKVISPEQFNELLPLADSIAVVVNVDTFLLTHRTPRKTHVKSGGAHGANRPGLNVPKNLESLVKYGECASAIYELLAKSYLAMLAEDYEYDFERGSIAEYPDFKATSSIPVKYGWKQIFGAKETGEDENKSEDSGRRIGRNATVFIHEGFPPKPKTPTMKWLMEQLSKRDVGTGATRTSTYAEVTNEKTKFPLLIDKKGKLSMSGYGEMSYTLLPGTKIGSLELTEELQEDMRAVASGTSNSEQLLGKIADYVTHDLRVMTDNGKGIAKKPHSTFSSTVIGKCKKCGKDVVENSKAYSCVGGKECGGFFIWEKKIASKVIPSAQIKKLLKEGKTDKIKGFKNKEGKEFEATLIMKSDFKIGFEFG